MHGEVCNDLHGKESHDLHEDDNDDLHGAQSDGLHGEDRGDLQEEGSDSMHGDERDELHGDDLKVIEVGTYVRDLDTDSSWQGLVGIVVGLSYDAEDDVDETVIWIAVKFRNGIVREYKRHVLEVVYDVEVHNPEHAASVNLDAEVGDDSLDVGIDGCIDSLVVDGGDQVVGNPDAACGECGIEALPGIHYTGHGSYYDLHPIGQPFAIGARVRRDRFFGILVECDAKYGIIQNMYGRRCQFLLKDIVGNKVESPCPFE